MKFDCLCGRLQLRLQFRSWSHFDTLESFDSIDQHLCFCSLIQPKPRYGEHKSRVAAEQMAKFKPSTHTNYAPKSAQPVALALIKYYDRSSDLLICLAIGNEIRRKPLNLSALSTFLFVYIYISIFSLLCCWRSFHFVVSDFFFRILKNRPRIACVWSLRNYQGRRNITNSIISIGKNIRTNDIALLREKCSSFFKKTNSCF